ncbi:MAG: response regulator [Planctomycetes bacterium]|nr:response regulator [Planctomycetota bacterium]
MRSYSSLGMKFLLAIGLFSTAFSLFLIHQTWKSSHESLQQLLCQQAELAMAFEIALEEIGRDSDMETGRGSLPLTEAESAWRLKMTERVFEKVQNTYPHVIIRASGDQLGKILSRTGSEGLRIYRLFESNPTLEGLDRVIKFNDRAYLTKFRMERNDVSLTNPRSELRMIAIPLEGYRSQVNEQTMSRFSVLAFALLGLFAAIYCSFELLVGRRLKKIAAYFCRATDQQDVHFIPLQTRSQDEIGLLAKSFNRLREKLENLYKTLDGEVHERTFELQQVNSCLRHKVLECQQAEERANVLAHEAEAANLAKGNFLANMSHELRTPMNAIMGFSQVLSEENLKSEHQSYLKMITSNSQNLLLLINDILDYSKIESGKLEVEHCDCRIGDMLGEIESMLRPSAIQKKIQFEILQCDPIPEVIRTDPLRLRQCLINLVSNAIKFTETGHVYVNVTLQHSHGDVGVRFDIEDTGIGVSEEKRPLIFGVFTQADSATTRKYGGTGLGLSITRKLVKLLGGKISVVSTEGRGSVFTMVIPIGVQWPDEDAPIWNKYLPVDKINEIDETEKGTVMYNGKVLVAEDNPSNQKLIAILLQRMGLDVTLAGDGFEAVEQCGEQSFDIILMDMQMPNLNGYDATRQLRSQGIKTPIIAVTANAMIGDEQKCMDVGCDGYLSKPIDRNKMDKLVGQHLAVQIG